MDYSNKAAFVLFRDCVFPSSSLVHAGFPYGRTGEGPADNRGVSPGHWQVSNAGQSNTNILVILTGVQIHVLSFPQEKWKICISNTNVCPKRRKKTTVEEISSSAPLYLDTCPANSSNRYDLIVTIQPVPLV